MRIFNKSKKPKIPKKPYLSMTQTPIKSLLAIDDYMVQIDKYLKALEKYYEKRL